MILVPVNSIIIEIRKKEERNDESYINLTDEKFYEKIEKKYYKERVFNNIMEEKYGFKNYDRTNTVLASGGS